MKPVHRSGVYRGFFIEEENDAGEWVLFRPTPFGTRRAANDSWRKELRLLAKGYKFRVKLHTYEMGPSGLMKLDERPIPEHQREKRWEG